MSQLAITDKTHHREAFCQMRMRRGSSCWRGSKQIFAFHANRDRGHLRENLSIRIVRVVQESISLHISQRTRHRCVCFQPASGLSQDCMVCSNKFLAVRRYRLLSTPTLKSIQQSAPIFGSKVLTNRRRSDHQSEVLTLDKPVFSPFAPIRRRIRD